MKIRARKSQSSLMTTKTTDTRIADTIVSVFEHLDEGTVKYVNGMLLEDQYDEDTREAVREILLEDLSSLFDDDGTGFCDTLFALLDREKQEEAISQKEEAIMRRKNKQRNNINQNNTIAHI